MGGMAVSTWSTLRVSAGSSGGQVLEHCLLPHIVVNTHEPPYDQVLIGVGWVSLSSLLLSSPSPGAYCPHRLLAPAVHPTLMGFGGALA